MAVRAEGWMADPGDVCAASSCTGERERERGRQQGKRLGRGFLFVEAGAGGRGAPTPRDVGAAVAAMTGLTGRGPELSAAEVRRQSRRAARLRLPPEWAGALLGWRGAQGRSRAGLAGK